MFHTDMTPDEIIRAAEHQRKLDLYNAKMWRDHYQKIIDDLEAVLKEADEKCPRAARLDF